MVGEERIAEFVGVMLGDGSIGIYDTKAGDKIKIHRRVKVTLDSRNKEYTDHVSKLFIDVLDVKPSVLYKKKENAVDVATYRSDKLSYVTEKLGLKFSPKWDKMEIPGKYSKGRLGLFVLKGLFDTDGHLSVFNNNGTIYPRIEIRLCPSPAQRQVNEILDEFGFKYKVQKLERGKTRVRISGREQLNKWFELIGSSNPIHTRKFEQLGL